MSTSPDMETMEGAIITSWMEHYDPIDCIVAIIENPHPVADAHNCYRINNRMIVHERHVAFFKNPYNTASLVYHLLPKCHCVLTMKIYMQRMEHSSTVAKISYSKIKSTMEMPSLIEHAFATRWRSAQDYVACCYKHLVVHFGMKFNVIDAWVTSAVVGYWNAPMYSQFLHDIREGLAILQISIVPCQISKNYDNPNGVVVWKDVGFRMLESDKCLLFLWLCFNKTTNYIISPPDILEARLTHAIAAYHQHTITNQ